MYSFLLESCACTTTVLRLQRSFSAKPREPHKLQTWQGIPCCSGARMPGWTMTSTGRAKKLAQLQESILRNPGAPPRSEKHNCIICIGEIIPI